MPTDPRTILQQANAAVAAGDNEGFLAFCTDDVTWHFIGNRTITGKGAVRRYMDETYIHPPEFDVADLLVDGDTVVAIGDITITDAGGAQMRSAYCDVWRLRDGRLAELRAFVVPERT
ncbi:MULTISPECIES: nuclear transport factor 2 family protein [unclassified Luteimonas]